MDQRSVYCMNLKDNRKESNQADSRNKFEFCVQHQVIGIGWSPNETDPAFLEARKYLQAMQAGDLVWIKEPDRDMYYIAEISDQQLSLQTDPAFEEHDLSCYRNCKYYQVGTKDDLPPEHRSYVKSLTSLKTIQPRTDAELIRIINALYASVVSDEKTDPSNWPVDSCTPPKKPTSFLKKHKSLFIPLFCVILLFVAFLVIHEAVYTVRANNAQHEMNNKLEGQTFVSYYDNQMWVRHIGADGTYEEKLYRVDTNAEVPLKFKETLKTKETLDYYFSYWGNLISISYGAPQFDSNGNVVQFGSNKFTLASEEELSMIKQADDRESTKRTLGEFMMTLEEYRDAYKATDMPVSDDLIDLQIDNYCIPYKDAPTNTFFMVFEKPTSATSSDLSYNVLSTSALGKNFGYDYMMAPILLYLENIPGALTDIDEIVRRWNSTEERTTGNELTAEFMHNGIVYTRATSYGNGLRMTVFIKVDPDYEVYLADYPEFVDKANVQGTENDTSENNRAPASNPSESEHEQDNENMDTDQMETTTPCKNGHTWLSITETVHHDEVGHYEDVLTGYESVDKYHCASSDCDDSLWFYSLDELANHYATVHGITVSRDQMISMCYTDHELEPIYEKQWVVDSEAYDETVITGYECSVCGKTK